MASRAVRRQRIGLVLLALVGLAGLTACSDLDTLSPIVETDNPGTRVILFANAEGRKVYKAVLVKKTNRLKILNLDGGPPLYDAPL